ncbi:MAG: hypothetical protein AAF726_06035 [Planctomycetota bacterium]
MKFFAPLSLAVLASISAGCASTRLELTPEDAGVQRVYVIVDDAPTFEALFGDDDGTNLARELGDYAVSLSQKQVDGWLAFDYASDTETWSAVEASKPKEWFRFDGERLAQRSITVSIDRSGLPETTERAVCIIVLAEPEGSTTRAYHGRWIPTEELLASGFWIFKSGPLIRVELHEDDKPSRVANA